MKKQIHTTPHPNGGWQNKSAGAVRASKIFPTKLKAQVNGRIQALNNGAEHKIHGLNGKIQQSNSYGQDPNPPKDTR